MPLLSYPPVVTHATHPISPSAAQEAISTYLAQSKEKPHLLPDALLTTSGVEFSIHGRETGGLILHNLRRVEAGLRGEVLEPEPAFELDGLGAGDDMVSDGQIRDTEGRMQGADGRKKGGMRRKLNDVPDNADGEETGRLAQTQGADQADGWEDAEAYQKAQDGIAEGDLGRRSNAVTYGGEEPLVEVEGTGEKVTSKMDKEARKRAKKERGKKEKRERAEAAKNKNEE